MRKIITLPQVSDSKPRGEVRGIAQLLAISPEVVAAIIAQGVFSNSDCLVVNTVERVGAITGATYTHDRLAAFDGALAALKVNLDVPTLGTPNVADTDLMDVVFQYGMQSGEAGYLVGLAVGLALGSGRPFAGVDTKGGAR